MLDNILILAEGAAEHAEGGVPPWLVGLAMLCTLLLLLVITYAFGGMNQRGVKREHAAGAHGATAHEVRTVSAAPARQARPGSHDASH